MVVETATHLPMVLLVQQTLVVAVAVAVNSTQLFTLVVLAVRVL